MKVNVINFISLFVNSFSMFLLVFLSCSHFVLWCCVQYLTFLRKSERKARKWMQYVRFGFLWIPWTHYGLRFLFGISKWKKWDSLMIEGFKNKVIFHYSSQWMICMQKFKDGEKPPIEMVRLRMRKSIRSRSGIESIVFRNQLISWVSYTNISYRIWYFTIEKTHFGNIVLDLLI